MAPVINNIATALPPLNISQQDAADIGRELCCNTRQHDRLLATVYRRSGVQRRHSVLLESNGNPLRQSFFPSPSDNADRGPTTAARMDRYREHALPLARTAAQTALSDADTDADTLTHLVTVSCTGFFAPGIDIELIRALGAPPTTARTHVGFMGCHGAINGLRVGAAILGENPTARVLLCAVELCSLHFHYGWDSEKVVANALFADGAAAALLTGTDTTATDTTVADTTATDTAADVHAAPRALTLRATGSCIFPDSTDAMTWHIGDHGFEMTLAPQVPDLIHTHLRPWLADWLSANGTTIDGVASWAVHPGGPRIIDAVESALSLHPTATACAREVLADCGNMSSPTILFILKRILETNAPRPCVALAFGPGLTAEAALLI